jgi:hypothetical protein
MLILPIEDIKGCVERDIYFVAILVDYSTKFFFAKVVDA